MRAVTWRTLLGVAVASIAMILVTGGRGAWELLEAGISGAVLLAVLAGARRHLEAGHRLPWYVVAGGLGAILVEEVVRPVAEVAGGGTFFGAMDVLEAVGVLGIAAGVLLLVLRRLSGAEDRTTLLDAGVITLVIGVLLVVAGPSGIPRSASEMVDRGIEPLAATVLLGIVVKLGMEGAGKSPAYRLLAVGAAGFVAVEAAEVHLEATRWGDGVASSVGEAVIFLFVGLAALHPTMARLGETSGGRPWPLRQRVFLLGMSVAALPVAAVLVEVLGQHEDVLATLCSMVVVGVIAAMRMHGLGTSTERAQRALQEREGLLREAVAELERAQADRTRLLERLLTAAEDERRLVAAEIHDGPVQRLASANYDLEVVKRRAGRLADEPSISETVGKVQDGLREATLELRHIMGALRPPALDELGLEAALEDLAATFEASAGVRCSVRAELLEPVQDVLELVCYRVVQEALSNVARHAGATEVEVRVWSGQGRLGCEVRDDGKGFRVADMPCRGAVGLMGMRERVEIAGGRWHLWSAPGEGTRVGAIFDELRIDGVDPGARVPAVL